MPGNTKSACGTAGAPCQVCSQPYQQCVTGACAVDPDSKWQMTVVSASIKQIKDWDTYVTSANTPPDPFYGHRQQQLRLHVVADLLLLELRQQHLRPGVEPRQGDLHRQGVEDQLERRGGRLGLRACCAANIGDQDLVNGFKEIFSCPNPDDGVNYINSLKLKFDYMP
jgi:hypothetical protein